MRDASRESWEQYRRRILAETSRFIEWGLEHPDEVIEIPSKPVEAGSFPPKVGEWFWGIVLTDRVDSRVRRWRDFLRRRPKALFRRAGARLRRRGFR